MSLLGLTYPTTHDELKSAYRAACRRVHPDAGGSHADFIRLQYEYDRVKSDPSKFRDGAATLELRTIDGIPLVELGLGLGPSVNGRDCTECKHVGYKEYRRSRRVRCPWVSRSMSLRSGDWHQVWCRCGGTGFITEYRPDEKDYHRCSRCNGTGEVAMFNPVVIKGSLR